MQGIAPPTGCIKIIVSGNGSMEVTVGVGGIGYPVGSLTRVDHPEAGVIFKDATSKSIWVFLGGPTSGTWHELNPSGPDRMGTWGPC